MKHTSIRARLRLARRLAISGCLAATLAVVVAPSAPARTLDEAKRICPDGAVCLFQHVNWNGKHVAFRWGIADFRAFGFNDRASSLVNDSDKQFCLYEHVDYAWPNDLGRGYKVRTRVWRRTLHNDPYFADMASSGYDWQWGQVTCGLDQVN